MDLFWTYLNRSLSLLCWGSQSWIQYSTFVTAQDTVGILGYRITCQLRFSFSSISTPKYLLLQRASLNLLIAQPVFMIEIAPAQMQTLYLVLLNFNRLTQAHLSESLWVASLPFSMLTHDST